MGFLVASTWDVKTEQGGRRGSGFGPEHWPGGLALH